jgi:NADPH:quinone reductase-like Zn-dependent oxidoreductase
LGGGRRKYVPLMLGNSKEDLEQVGAFLRDQVIRVVVDEVVGFGDVVKAYEKLRSGRARGKIIVRVEEP